MNEFLFILIGTLMFHPKIVCTYIPVISHVWFPSHHRNNLDWPIILYHQSCLLKWQEKSIFIEIWLSDTKEEMIVLSEDPKF